MFTYTAPSELTDADWYAIQHSVSSAPYRFRHAPEAVQELIENGSWKAFRFRAGLVVVSIRNSRLMMEACSAKRGTFGWTLRQLGKDLRRLASDWGCDTIETTCYDPRHTKAILRVGGRIESMQVVLRAKD